MGKVHNDCPVWTSLHDNQKGNSEHDSKCNEEDEGGEGEKPATETSQMETIYRMDSTQSCNE